MAKASSLGGGGGGGILDQYLGVGEPLRVWNFQIKVVWTTQGPNERVSIARHAIRLPRHAFVRPMRIYKQLSCLR